MLSARVTVCLFLFIATCAAQLDNASLFGTVMDPSGKVIVSVIVKVQNIDTSQTVEVTTDANGNYFAPVLRVGKYHLTVQAAGFRTAALDNIVLRAADRVRVNVTLEIGAVQQTLTIADAAPLLETGSSTLGDVVGTQQITQLPVNGRAISSMLSVLPGANLLTSNERMSVNGANMYRVEGSVKFLMDGADASRIDFDIVENDYGTAKARMTRASMDAIEEVRMQTSSFSAEYGNALGGVVNMITKSGTNGYHGSLIEFFRNEKLDTRNYFNPGTNPEFRLNQFGGSLGGPIIHDKFFYFLNYEGVRQRSGVTYSTVVPTAGFRATLPSVLQPVIAGLPLPNGPVSASEPRLGTYTASFSDLEDEDVGMARIDYLFSTRNRMSFRYNGNGSLTNSNYGIAQGQSTPAAIRAQLAKADITTMIAPNVLNEAGFAVNRLYVDKFSAASQEIRDLPTVSMGGGVMSLGPKPNDNRVRYTLYTWMDTLSWVKGRNQFKFGGQIIRNQENRTLLLMKSVTYQNLTDFANNSPFSIGTSGQPESGMRGTYNDFFVQDDIQLSRRVTLNTGLRYQYDTTPTEAHGQIANFDPATGKLDPIGTPILNAPAKNFAPRVGIAWSPSGNSRTVVRSGFGLFYAALNPYLAQPLPNNVAQYASSFTRQQNPDLVGFPFPNISSFAAVSSLTALPKDYKGVYMEQWNVNIQRAVGTDSMVQVTYLGSRGLHLNSTRDINRLLPGTAIRPYAGFGTITYYTNGNISNYNAFQASFRHRFRKGLSANVHYSWAHNLDNTMAQFGTAPQNDANQRLEYSNSDADLRHQLQFDYTYQLPAAPGLPKWLISGWEINGITVMRSGTPVNVVCGCDSAGIGATTGRPNYVAGVPVRPAHFDMPGSQINIAAFSLPMKGSFGNLGRNVLTGPAAYNWDLSIDRIFHITEHRTLQFRAESFNVFNTPIFSNPAASLAAPATFGRSLSTLSAVGQGSFGTNRQSQLGLRFLF